MSERTETFEIGGRARLVLRVPSGEIRVVPGKAGEVLVRCRADQGLLSRVAIDRDGDTISVGPEGAGFGRWPSLEVEVAVGAPPDVRTRCGSADVRVETTVSSLEVVGASGNVSAGTVEGALTVRLASGDLELESVGSRAVMVTASGRVRLRRGEGSVEAKSASGDIVLGQVRGDCSARTASGRVVVSRFDGSHLEVKTVSGDVLVKVPAGRRYSVSLQTLSGDVGTDFPVSGEGQAAPARLVVSSISGDIRIAAAEAD